jgi:4-methoxybenzoate monooxygenase (O-demethylating)
VIPENDVIVIDVDPFEESFLADPFPALHRLREAGPAVFLSRWRVWAMAGHEEVSAALRDHERFSSAFGAGLANLASEEAWRKPSILLELDPPVHTRNPAVVAKVLSPKALRGLQEAFDQAAAELIGELVRRSSVDGVTDLAEVFPTVVFPSAFGLDGDAREPLLRYGAIVSNGMGPRNALFERSMEGAAEVIGWIGAQCARDRLQPGSIGASIYDSADQAGVTEEDTALLIRSFLSAGVDTTVSGLAFALYRLATNPGQWGLLRDNPELARSAFEETVRIDSPVVGFFRTTSTEVEIAQAHIEAGQKVLLFFAGANRDPRRWPDPDRFDIQRQTAGHLGFGFGRHVCVGMAIARMEGEAVLKALPAHVAAVELTGEPRLRLNNSLRGLDTLPLRRHAA